MSLFKIKSFWDAGIYSTLSILTVASIVTSDLEASLIFAYGQVSCLLLLVLHQGGLYKGSTSYESFLFFLATDLAAFFSLHAHYPYREWVILLPGFSRMLFPLTAPYVRGLFFNCPTSLIILILSTMTSAGMGWIFKINSPLKFMAQFQTGCFVLSGLMLVLFFIEKSRRQKSIYLLMSQTPLLITALLLQKPWSIPIGFLSIFNSILWLLWLENPRLRILNWVVAIFCLLLLVTCL